MYINYPVRGVCPSCGHCPQCGRGGYTPSGWPSYGNQFNYGTVTTGNGNLAGNLDTQAIQQEYQRLRDSILKNLGDIDREGEK
jgi:hypothetical protein